MAFLRTFFRRCLSLVGLVVLSGCTLQPTERNVQRSFYYWKTRFAIDTAEAHQLRTHKVQKLYLRFLDVDWDELAAEARPAGPVRFDQPPPAGMAIIPVTYLTQEVLKRSDSAGLDRLAGRLARHIATVAGKEGLNLGREVQIDCDWTASTRDRYFLFLRAFRRQPLMQGRILSATIRLHQLKFRDQTGVPPADRGLLMAYNMGNLHDPSVRNSILDPDELSRYTGRLPSYPLPMDVALPIFDWWVLFDRDQYKGLVRDLALTSGKERIDFSNDTTIGGYSFRAGEWLKHERSEAADVLRAAQELSRKLKTRDLTVILYHLDSRNLANYSLDDLESFYRCFR